MHNKSITLMLLLAPLFLFANPIEKGSLKEAGLKAFRLKAEKYSSEFAGKRLASFDVLYDGDEPYAAVLNFDKGFLILAADDAVTPVLAYDFDNNFHLDDVAPASLLLLEQYRNEISAVRKYGLAPDERAVEGWNEILGNGSRNGGEASSVGPLINSAWNQNKYYNYYSPIDEGAPAGYDNKTPNGCVAVAMSQIMYYYRYPKKGTGYHTNHSSYGSFFVNFAQQTYNYDAMSDILSHYNNEVSKLIFHCGVAVDMNYAADGSGAYSYQVPAAMKSYFGYSNAAQYVSKYNYSGDEWNELLKSDLSQLRPVYYSGYSEEGGHAFVCDGYNDEDYFHFNFGWGGSGNGYFVTSSTSSDEMVTGGYSGSQSAIIRMYPDETKYPEYCNDRIITALYGNLEDGSGNKDYTNNQYCTYVITAPNQYSVNVILRSFETEENHDVLKFWNGHPSHDSLLLEISGDMPSQTNYYLETDSLYITFETDGDSVRAGWRLYYYSYRDEPGCGNHTYYDHSGSISSGGENNYRDNSNCVWNLRINHAEYIKFTFNELDISPEDHLDFYDLSSYPPPLLTSVTGSELIDPLVFPLNKVRVVFVSDNYLNAKGFNVSWSTDQTDGIDDIVNAASPYPDLYPNPASSTLNVRFNDGTPQDVMKNTVVTVYDAVGRCVISAFSASDSRFSIPVNALAEGFYTIRFEYEGKSMSRKFVVKH
ncbi:MAG: C10 family peptidase [Bacteroidales bacterium]|nr:C10 family peptidase [Bacteroidales bacterium]MDY6346810.1 C10 family peptidase [Bacteroidales bacterium]